jgi:hypothetical protein
MSAAVRRAILIVAGLLVAGATCAALVSGIR